MSRIPKWLMLKEHLTFDDVNKLLESTPSSIENVLALDCSEDFGFIYKFMCTFSPETCQMQFKEYRFENVARQSIRAHLKDHINDMKLNCSEETKKAFSTKNQLFKGSKNGTTKHKLSVSNEVLSGKKQRNARNDPDSGHQISTKEQRKPRVQRFTKLKKLQKEKASEMLVEEKEVQVKNEVQVKKEIQVKDEYDQVMDEIVQQRDDSMDELKIEENDNSLEEDENTTDDKMDSYCSDDADGGDKISCETQTDHAGKEQETLQYKIATKLFAVDRSFWNNIEQILDDIVDAEKSDELLSQSDKDMILKGMRQWMDSVQIYDKHAMSRLQDPLSVTERSTLNGLTVQDWKKLEKGQDNESKLRLTVYANMLLREYESYPRKLKPKYCQHCEKLYTASTSLYSHLVSLAGIRHWVCSRCKDTNKVEATFTRKHSLQYHILKEVGIPRYRCQQPGCNRTHNHTHHQKSHARQHTGEKHYICSVDGCRSRFSNRNTYSRHLLQFHHVELTRTNQLRAIDEKEATCKVNAARLKARERSKCKRQQGSETRICGPHDQILPDAAPKKRTIDENILNAARHFLTEVKQEEDKLNETEELSTKMNFEKGMRHSASQLLSGIARDVGSTTSLMVESKSPENMMGGLNLLATVSKYMNAKTCTDIDNATVSEISEQSAASQQNSDWEHSENHVLPYNNNRKSTEINHNVPEETAGAGTPKQNVKHSFPEVKVMAVTNVKLLTMPTRSDNTSQHSKLMQVIQPPFGQHRTVSSVKANSEFPKNLLSQTIQLTASRNVQSSSVLKSKNKDQNCAESNSSVTALTSLSEASSQSANEDSSVPSHPELSATSTQAYSQSGFFAVKNQLGSVSPNVGVINENDISLQKKIFSDPTCIKQVTPPNAHSLIISRNAALLKFTSSQQSSGGNDGIQNNITVINSSAQSSDEQHGQPHLVKTPLSALTSNSSIKCDSPLPGKAVAESNMCNHLTASNKVNLALASTVSNQTPNKNIQVIKVANNTAQLQLRSVSCMSGKTYLVLTSSAAHPTTSTNDESSGSRILPFSEL